VPVQRGYRGAGVTLKLFLPVEIQVGLGSGVDGEGEDVRAAVVADGVGGEVFGGDAGKVEVTVEDGLIRASGSGKEVTVRADDGAAASEEERVRGDTVVLEDRGVGRDLVAAENRAAADHHSIDMATKNYFSHTLSGGVTWSQNIANHGYSCSTATAEDIATASATFTQWKNSSGHNATMLTATYTAIGIGCAYSSSSTYGRYWTAIFGGYQDAAVTCSS
jgi:hypothetical protein